jgi:alkylation response protein AidB-like acyl-CoA dehydrogenase
MNFDLSAEQELLQGVVGEFLERDWPPLARREIIESETGFDPTLWKGLAELGVAGTHIESEFGGAGLELLDLALVVEALGYGCVPGPFLGHVLAAMAIQLAGSADQRRNWLPRLAAGDAIGTVAVAETGGGWQPNEWEMAGGDSLTGTKPHVPFASVADVLIVGTTDGGFALVESDADGMTIEASEGVDRSRRLGTVTFDATPCEALPGAVGAAERIRDAALVLLAADAFGCGSRLVEMSVDYAKAREQFGVTIGHFQAVKHQLATMAVELEPSRALFWYAAHAFDSLPDERERAAAVAKAHITDRVMQIARDAVEAHGGIGFTWECDVQLWFKRAMFDRAFLGTPDVHRERAARLAGW